MLIHSKLLILMLIFVPTLEGQAPEAVPHSRPYMVILEQHMQNGTTAYCHGFLVSEDFVMTAAHCQARSYTVLLGVHNFHSNDKERVSVDLAFPHKDYNKTTYENDIMLLKLSSKATFSKNVKPITIAGRDDGSPPKSCLLSGWGATENSKYMSAILREVNVTLIDNELCESYNFYCSEGETGPSKGDSGGPLVCEGKAYGVVSNTFNPATGGPKIHCYAKIPVHRGWIDSTMNSLKRFNVCHI